MFAAGNDEPAQPFVSLLVSVAALCGCGISTVTLVVHSLQSELLSRRIKRPLTVKLSVFYTVFVSHRPNLVNMLRRNISFAIGDTTIDTTVLVTDFTEYYRVFPAEFISRNSAVSIGGDPLADYLQGCILVYCVAKVAFMPGPETRHGNGMERFRKCLLPLRRLSSRKVDFVSGA